MWNLKCKRAKNQKRWRTEHFSFHCKWAFIKIVCVLNWLYWIYIQIHINKFKKRVILFTRVPLDFPVTSLVRLSRAKNALRYKCHHLGLKKCLGRPVIPSDSTRELPKLIFRLSRRKSRPSPPHNPSVCPENTGNFQLFRALTFPFSFSIFPKETGMSA